MANVKNTFFRSFKTQIAAVVLLICAVSVAVCSYVLYSVMSGDILKKTEQQNADYSNQMAYVLDYVIQDLDRYAAYLTTSPVVMDALKYDSFLSNSPAIAAFKSFIAEAQQLTTGVAIDSVFFYLDNNMIIGQDSKSNVFFNTIKYPDRIVGRMSRESPDFTKLSATGSLRFSGVFSKSDYIYGYDALTVYPCLSFSRAYNMPGKSYILVINVSETAFKSLYQNETSGYSSMYAVDGGGTVISDSDAAQIGAKSAAFDALLKVNTDQAAYRENGVSYQVIRSPVGDTGLSLITLISKQAILSGSTQYRNLMILLIILTIIIVVPVLFFVINRLNRPLSNLVRSMKEVERGHVPQKIAGGAYYETDVLAEQFNSMSLSIANLEQRIQESESEKRDAELQVLQSYINPHFLYNTLNAFRLTATMVGANKLANALGSFGLMLRPLYAAKDDIWTCREERDFIENYLSIMNYRYGGGVKSSVMMPDEILGWKILKFVVQPLVENAFSYGIDPIDSTGTIRIDFKPGQDMLLITVGDEGPGVPPDKLSELQEAMRNSTFIYGEHGMGIANISRRLRLHYGESGDIGIESNPSGTIITVRLPIIKEQIKDQE